MINVYDTLYVFKLRIILCRYTQSFVNFRTQECCHINVHVGIIVVMRHSCTLNYVCDLSLNLKYLIRNLNSKIYFL